MIIISSLIIPIIIFIIILYGIYKKIDIYEEFISGAKESISMSLKLFPSILAMIIAINVFIKSGFFNDLLSILFNFFPNSYYKDLIPLFFTRSISGSSSIALLNNILSVYGPDSKIGIIASVMQGTTETTIYVLSIYFGSVGIKNTKYALFIGLFADFISIFFSFLIINMFYL